MKKWIVPLFVIISIVSFFILFNKENYSQLSSMRSAEQTKKSYRVLISTGDKKQEEIYRILKILLDKYQGNIYYTQITKDLGRSGYIKYIYLTDLEYYRNFKLTRGRFFTRLEFESDKFLSTRNTGESQQIGQISDFAGDDVFEIRTLKSMLNSKKSFEGSFILQTGSSQGADLFIKELSRMYGIYAEQRPIYPDAEGTFPFEWVIAVCYFVLMLLVFYNLLNSYKKIGIEKMLGFRGRTIWLKRMVPLVVIQVFIMTVVSCLLILLNFKEYNQYFTAFILKLAGISGLFSILTAVFISIPFLYIHKITVSNMLKNRQPIKTIIMFNTVVKIGLTVAFLISSIGAYSQYVIVASRYNDSFRQWESTKEYAIIPIIQDISQEKLSSVGFLEAQKELYVYFNQKGSVLADFSEFSPETRKIRVKENPFSYQSDYVEVNPNYLKKHPIYDINGRKIDVVESENQYVLLIPEQYRSSENEIRKYYQFIKNGYVSVIDGKEVPSIVKNQKIKIIWTKANQKLFTYRININPMDGNNVTNPIVRVITEANGGRRDFDRIIAYSGNPFKIKVDNPLDPSAEVRPVLQRLNLNQYIPVISSVYDAVEAESKQTRDIMQFILAIWIVSAGMIIIISLQNIYNYIEQHRQRLAIQQLHGYKKLDKYKGYFKLVSAGWLIIFIITKLTGSIKLTELIPLAAFFIAVELVVSLFILGLAEKRKVLRIAKGG
ncbi:MAG: DUF1430 domain-containing protein [Clostridia bacterium]|nr:DUF1430 domain-containing protein [Clostridia bacterium]